MKSRFLNNSFHFCDFTLDKTVDPIDDFMFISLQFGFETTNDVYKDGVVWDGANFDLQEVNEITFKVKSNCKLTRDQNKGFIDRMTFALR